MTDSVLEEAFAFQLQAKGLTAQMEYPFAREIVGNGKGIRDRLKQAGLQDWKFDFAFPEVMLAVEIEGGGWSGGRHTRGKGFAQDMKKYHHAMDAGWNVYRCNASLINSKQAIELVEKLYINLLEQATYG